MDNFKSIPVAQAQGAALDWLVAKCLGLLDTHTSFPYSPEVRINCNREIEFTYANDEGDYDSFYPSSNWSQAGPIIEREGIALGPDIHKPAPSAYAQCVDTFGKVSCLHTEGPTFLIAAMRCYVASKMGDTVEVPEELLA